MFSLPGTNGKNRSNAQAGGKFGGSGKPPHFTQLMLLTKTRSFFFLHEISHTALAFFTKIVVVSNILFKWWHMCS